MESKNTFYGSNEARSAAFRAVPETCPVVKQILARAHKSFVDHFLIEPDNICLDITLENVFKAITEEVTIPLRRSLIDAEQKAIEK